MRSPIISIKNPQSWIYENDSQPKNKLVIQTVNGFVTKMIFLVRDDIY
jgi:hypothetical protein